MKSNSNCEKYLLHVTDFHVARVREEIEQGKHPLQNQDVVSKTQISWDVKHLANCRDKKFWVEKHTDKILS